MRAIIVVRRAARGLVSVLFLLIGAAPNAVPEDAASHLGRVRIANGWTRNAVASAIRGAQRRLRDKSCQQLLTDFSDASGRPLRDRLAELEQTIGGYLELVYFVDGSETPQCKGTNVTFAYTTVGSRVVFVCGAPFSRGRSLSAGDLEIIVIHETLHTLGLGENPPTSSEITGRVRFRCIG